MNTALVVVLTLAAACIGLSVALYRQSRSSAAPPAAVSSGFVRAVEYDADLSGVRRHLSELEGALESLRNQTNGALGALKREEKRGAKDDLRELLQQALVSRGMPERDAMDQPAATGGMRVVRLPAKRSG